MTCLCKTNIPFHDTHEGDEMWEAMFKEPLQILEAALTGGGAGGAGGVGLDQEGRLRISIAIFILVPQHTFGFLIVTR